uniref:Uncharacterized protein n=1 Tax=Phyllymenia taiwanensis TaxID=1260292 RepID=R9XXT6_9FLOR|nr:hypothetical protein [Grateloupia taiwanensis]AGO19794.1 hypothetical protein [Grateloupia taiwanensis]
MYIQILILCVHIIYTSKYITLIWMYKLYDFRPKSNKLVFCYLDFV